MVSSALVLCRCVHVVSASPQIYASIEKYLTYATGRRKCVKVCPATPDIEQIDRIQDRNVNLKSIARNLRHY